MTPAVLQDLVVDVRTIQLLAALEDRLSLSPAERADIIIGVFGAQDLLVDDRDKRNSIFLALTGEQRGDLAKRLRVETSQLENFRMSSLREKTLWEYFELEPEEVVEEESATETVYVATISPQYGLFPHQSTALFMCRDLLEDSEKRRVMLHMPTGSGKTRTATHLICRHLNNRPKGLVLWIAHGQELCDQASEELSNAWAMLGERSLKFVRFYGDASDAWPSELDDGIIVAGLSKLWKFIPKLEAQEVTQRAKNLSLIIFDEAHQSVAPTYKQMVDILMDWNPEIGLLGLSATPGRSYNEDDDQGDTQLIDLFGGNKVKLNVEGHSSPVHYLQEEGYLARMEYKQIQYVSSAMDAAALQRVRQGLENEFSIPEDYLKELGLDNQRNLEIVKTVNDLLDADHKRIILFSPSVQNSDLIAAILRSQEINAESVTQKSGAISRQDKINKFKDKDDPEPMVLCNYGILTTGFDAPRTSAVIIARPTNSIVLYSQMAGRAIRGPEVGGNENAEVHTVMDTSIEVFCDLVTQFTNWDQQWRNNN